MAPHGNRRATVAAGTASGLVELRPDPAYPRAWTLLVGGVPQSYVDLDDPEHLDFGCLTLIGVALRRCAPAGMLGGERAGNIVLLAGAAVRPAVGPLISGPEWEGFAVGARPLLDAPR